MAHAAVRIAVFAAAGILWTAAAAPADSLGARFGALRDLVEERVAAIPATGAPAKEKKERGLLVAALALLDADSPTLDTDAAIAAQALGLLKKARSPILQDPAAFALRTDLFYRVQDLHDDPHYLPFYFNTAAFGKMNRLGVLAQFWIGKGFLSPDPAGAAKAFLKAVKLVRQEEATAAKALKPAPGDSLKIGFGFVQGADDEYHDSRKEGAAATASYDTGTDVVTFEFTFDLHGAARHMVVHVPAPAPGAVDAVDPAATLEADGFTCDYDQASVHFAFSAWDPESGLAAGSFTLAFQHPDPPGSENEVPCAGAYGNFTIRQVTVLP